MGTIWSGKRSLTTEELVLRGARAGAGLERLGIGAGDGVAIYLRNDLAFFEAVIGAVFLDQGFARTARLLDRFFRRHLPLMVAVADNGSGIPDEELDSVARAKE